MARIGQGFGEGGQLKPHHICLLTLDIYCAIAHRIFLLTTKTHFRNIQSWLLFTALTDMRELSPQTQNNFRPVLCPKCGKEARLTRRVPITAFSLEETHTFECVDPECGHQMQIEGRG
jgi:hypothetical protein